jgi:alanyl-tRNA synthetase
LEWEAVIDELRRDAIRQHHTATHLLQAALRQVLGKHVAQAGSRVAPDRLRFDFTHFAALSPEEREEVERRVNQTVQQNLPVEVRYTTYDEAIRDGVVALFGEKYDAERVRRVRVPGFSEELCGGTHARATGDIGPVLIVDETAVAAGTRRIEAVCGQTALAEVQRMRAGVTQLRRLLGTGVDEAPEKVAALMQEIGKLRKDLSRARRGEGVSHLDRLLEKAESVGRARFVVGEVQAASVDELRDLGDRVRQQLGSGAAVLCAKVGKKTSFLAVVSRDLIDADRLRADEIVRKVAGVTGGSGGGRPHMALGGAGDRAKLPAALDEARRLLRESLSS